MSGQAVLLTVRVNGVDVTDHVHGLSTSDDPNGVGRASFTIDDVIPVRGQLVQIQEDGVTVWEGTVSEVGPEFLGYTSGSTSTVTAYGHNELLARTDPITAETIPAQTVLATLQWACASGGPLHVHGVTVHPSQVAGPTLGAISCAGMTAEDLIAELRSRAHMVGGIGPGKVIRLWAIGDLALGSPFTLSRSAGTLESAQGSDQQSDYINSYRLVCGGTSQVARTFAGLADGGTHPDGKEYFRVPYPVPRDITIPWPNQVWVNGTPIPASWGEHPLFWWQWIYDDASGVGVMVHLDSDPERGKLPAGTTVAFGYTEQCPFVYTAKDDADIAAKGFFPATETKDAITSLDEAAIAGAALLATAMARARGLSVVTGLPGYRPGYTVPVNLPEIGFTGTAYIQAVEVQYEETEDGQIGQGAVERTTTLTCAMGSGLVADGKAIWARVAGSASGSGGSASGGSGGGAETAATPLLSSLHADTVAASPVLGDLIVGNATPAWQRLAGQTTATRKFLSQTGTGSVSAVPSWLALAAADIPSTLGATTFAQGTLTNPAPNLLGTATWNDAADTMIGWRLNVTDSASAAGSLLLDLQVGAASKFAVSKAGGVSIKADLALANATGLYFRNSENTGNVLGLFADAAEALYVGDLTLASKIALRSTAGLVALGDFTNSYPALKRNGAAIDLRLADDSGYAGLAAAGISGTSLASSGTITVHPSGTGGYLYLAPYVGTGASSYLDFRDSTNTRYAYLTAYSAGPSFGVYLENSSYFAISGGNAWTQQLGPLTNYAYDLGTDSNRWRTLRAAELNVWKLVARSVVASVGGEIWTAETTTLTADLGSAVGDTTITVADNNLASGDRILLKSLANLEWMAVTSGAGGSAGAYTYSVTRDLDGTGRNAWAKGTAIVNSGTTGNGLITQYAESSSLPSAIGSGTLVGPTIVGVVRTGAAWNNLAPRWAIGNLNGLYGYSGDTYGFAAGDPSNAWIKVDATNGVRIGHNATTKISLSASGNASFTGAVTATSGTFTGTVNAGAGYFGDGSSRVAIESSGLNVGSSGSIRGGASDYGTGTGFWLGYDSAYRFRIGNPSGQRAFFDGTNFGFYGAHWSMTASGGLAFDAASPGTSANAVNWSSGAQVGGDSNVLWLWSPGGASSAYYVNIYSDKINLGKGGTGDFLRVTSETIGTFRNVLPDANVARNLGSDDPLYFNAIYVNHVLADYDANGSVTAYTFADLTPWPEGEDALAAILQVKGDGKGQIDHATLPAYAAGTLTRKTRAGKADEVEKVPTRNLGAMVSLLTVAMQQQAGQIAALQDAVAALKAA